MESLEGVIEVGFFSDSVQEVIESELCSAVDLLVIVLHVVVVDFSWSVSATESLVHSVAVNFPQSIDSLVNVVLKVILAQRTWGNQPEQHVVGLQLEHS